MYSLYMLNGWVHRLVLSSINPISFYIGNLFTLIKNRSCYLIDLFLSAFFFLLSFKQSKSKSLQFRSELILKLGLFPLKIYFSIIFASEFKNKNKSQRIRLLRFILKYKILTHLCILSVLSHRSIDPSMYCYLYSHTEVLSYLCTVICTLTPKY